MSKYATEFVGAFFLVLTIGLTTVQGVVPAPLAIGAALMILVYMGGHISGAHYNPAISIAIMVRGKLDRKGGVVTTGCRRAPSRARSRCGGAGAQPRTRPRPSYR